MKKAEEEEELVVLRRSARIGNRKLFWDNELHLAQCYMNDVLSYDESLNSPEKEKWIAAINAEIGSSVRNDTFVIVYLPAPAGKPVLKTKWILKIKDPEDKKIYRTGLVIKGCSQKYGRDYGETFAPDAK